ncbi:MAG: hypothetical protein RSC76_00270, partial [Oscillospiraceae bacterium]
KSKEFDVSGYIKSVLDSTYRLQNENYIVFTGTTNEMANSNHTTTISNAAVHFLEKYKINASDTQRASLESIFSAVYQNCPYTVLEKVKTDSGYNITVNYTPMIAFQSLSTQIESIKGRAGDSAYNIGAAYIDDVIALCKSVSENPTYGEVQSQIFDIRLSENGELSLNIHLFTLLDEQILPF